MISLRIYISFIFMLLYLTTFSAINPPELKCVSIDNNENVTLTWIPIASPNSSFNSYVIYFSQTITGPYTEITRLNSITQTSYKNTSANAEGFYYMVSLYNSPDLQYSESSDTLRTINLVVSNPLNGIAILNWNSPSTNTNLEYEIYYEYPLNTWNFTNSTSSTHFIDTIKICESQINYKIEIEHSTCRSVSSVSGSIFKNLIPPDIPFIDSVSINPISQNAIIGWKKSFSSDTKGYIIYKFASNIWTPIDTVDGINNTFFENTNSEAINTPEKYSIAAMDSCGITSPIADGHSSILLNTFFDICSNSLSLSWSQYCGFDVKYYEIYISENNNTFESSAIVPSSETHFSIDNFNNNSSYRIFVKAVSAQAASSSSNIKNFHVHKPDLPDFVYLRYASVNDNGNVDLAWIVDETAKVNSFILQRKEALDLEWSDIDIINFQNIHNYSVVDNSAYTNLKSYDYRIAVVDSCGNKQMFSNIISTIFLSATAASMKNNLEWTLCKGWLGDVSSYTILRKTTNEQLFYELEVSPASTSSFTDNIDLEHSSSSSFSYKIMALESTGNTYSLADTMWSNTVQIKQVPLIFIPNAFAPEGENKTFAPYGIFVNNEFYSFKIFNRFGQIVFSTNNFADSWDGLTNGIEAPVGVYTYIISLNFEGDTQTFRGFVTLIR